jgi:hypothetical protein
MYEHGTLKVVKVTVVSGRGKRENSGGDEPNHDTLTAYMEMLTKTPCENYYMLVKTFKKSECCFTSISQYLKKKRRVFNSNWKYRERNSGKQFILAR